MILLLTPNRRAHSPSCARHDRNNRLPFSFPAVGAKKVTAAFDGGRLTWDGGVMLLAMAERRLGVADRLARRFPDHRDPSRILHTRADMIRARIHAIATSALAPLVTGQQSNMRNGSQISGDWAISSAVTSRLNCAIGFRQSLHDVRAVGGLAARPGRLGSRGFWQVSSTYSMAATKPALASGGIIHCRLR